MRSMKRRTIRRWRVVRGRSNRIKYSGNRRCSTSIRSCKIVRIRGRRRNKSGSRKRLRSKSIRCWRSMRGGSLKSIGEVV